MSKSILAEAKAFLCWDIFDDVAIQLVPLQGSAAFYVPPHSDVHSILLFYDQHDDDFSEPLFLLFHEAGHRKQIESLGKEFDENIALPNGPKRQEFEQEAWRLARSLFNEFIDAKNLDAILIEQFDQFAQKSVNSYSDISKG